MTLNTNDVFEMMEKLHNDKVKALHGLCADDWVMSFNGKYIALIKHANDGMWIAWVFGEDAHQLPAYISDKKEDCLGWATQHIYVLEHKMKMNWRAQP